MLDTIYGTKKVDKSDSIVMSKQKTKSVHLNAFLVWGEWDLIQINESRHLPFIRTYRLKLVFFHPWPFDTLNIHV